ncbi:MAG: VWA domain-containing protein [Sphingobacteriales bacterium]|nr:MAG: VWA domain-containing protein [Sphingobacteriales bacterium]
MDWEHISFAHPYFFGLLLLIPLIFWWQHRRKQKLNPAIRLTSVESIRSIPPGFRIRMRPLMQVLRVITLVAIITALARPQSSNVTETSDSEGIDIVLSVDVSGSMLAEDLKPNRIEAAKKVAIDFIEQRPTDRIGLVVFSGESFTQCPITIDHDVLKEQLSQIKSGILVDGTAIGDGLATAVDRIRRSNGESKVVILLTDGVNNIGKVGPELALEVAKTFKVRVYTIGIGTKGMAEFPYDIAPNGQFLFKMMPVEIDEKLMQSIADKTGGKYFRATSNGSLEKIYEEINKLETTEIEELKFYDYDEQFRPFAILALVLLLAEVGLRNTVFRSFI